MAGKQKDDEKQDPKQPACIYCGHKNDADASFCGGCGINFKVGRD